MAWDLTRTWLVRHPESTIGQIAKATGQTRASVGNDLARNAEAIDHRGMRPRVYAMMGYRWPERTHEPRVEGAGLGKRQRAIVARLRARAHEERDLCRVMRMRRLHARRALQAMLARGIVVKTIEAPGRVVWSLNKAEPSAAGGEHVG